MSGSTLKNTKINHFFASCRPRLWTKNLLCFSAFFITPFSSVSNIYKLIFATISFVLASSFIYIINDLIDNVFNIRKSNLLDTLVKENLDNLIKKN